VRAQARLENFPVALRWLPAQLRRDLLALYGFARLADDLGDEVEGDRLACLDALEQDLERAFAGTARHPLLRRLTPTLHAHSLPREPFQRLIEANRRDQRVHRYETFDALLGYCALSANPVGHLVLHVAGAATPENLELSDAVCTALQIVEHLQDVAEDRARGRVYLPAVDLARFGCSEEDLCLAPAPPELRRLVAFEAERARTLLRRAEPLVARLRWPARLAVAAFAGGGQAALGALARGGFDVTSSLLAPRRRDTVWHTLAILCRARRRWGRP
jgi:squalene synthase HpnC